MVDTFQIVTGRLRRDNSLRFWLFQLAGWSAYSLATFLTITLVDGNVRLDHVIHIGLQSCLGILVSWPMRPLFRIAVRQRLAAGMGIAVACVVVFSAIWTAVRILTFSLISGEDGLWGEFHYWYFGSLFVFLSWGVLYYADHYYVQLAVEHEMLLLESSAKQREQLRRVQAESLARDAQLQMLRYQLNPHFLFNTLNAIYSLVRAGENRRAEEMISLLSDFLRDSLDRSHRNIHSLQQELDSLMLYLDIEKVRFEGRLNLEFDIEPLARSAAVPAMILQPTIENAMKYAIAPSETGGTVRICASVQEGDLVLEVCDTGPGVSGVQDGDNRGIGLRNTISRLETLYQGRSTFTAEDLPGGGARVCLRFPFSQMPREQSEVAQV